MRAPSATLAAYFSDYERYHQNPNNRRTHDFGIPLLVISILGLLGKISLIYGVSIGSILWLSTALWYVRVDPYYGSLMSFLTFCLLLIGSRIPSLYLSVFFLVGWALQLWGHYHFEKKSPAFTTNLRHLFVGPLWILARLLG